MMGMTMAQTPKTPSVSIENVTLTAPTSVSFNIVVNDDCDKYLYLISDTSFFQLAAAFGMTHAQFMELMPQYGIEWVTATTGQVDNYTSSDLEPNSTYGIYVLAKNAQDESFVTEYLFNTLNPNLRLDMNKALNIFIFISFGIFIAALEE